jgi:DNA-binding NtrC family response regulator
MKKIIEILAVGTKTDIVETVQRLINKNPDWNGTCAYDKAQAIEIFASKDFDLVLLGGGLDDASELELITKFNTEKPEVPVVQHFGGGSGLLFSEIQAALTK